MCNLKLDEQKMARLHLVKKCMCTSGQFGSANLVLTSEMHGLVKLYIEQHRPTPLEEFK